MPKSFYLFIYFWLMALCTIAQNNSGVLKYRDITAFRDTVHYVVSERTLVFNANESLLIGGISKQFGKDTTLNYNKTTNTLPEIIYKNFVTHKIISSETAFKENILMNEVLIDIAWVILPEHKKIGKFNCQKAEADIRGRHYTAWFTAEVPVSNGPWKLHGLPGLILEAFDRTKEVRFEFESLTIPAPEGIKIEPLLPKEKQKTLTMREYVKLAEDNKKNFIKMLQSDPKSEGGEIKIKIKMIEIFSEK